MECPICYDEIETTKNCITTECGHKFHAKCLMKNARINGFSCPSCRAQMVEVESEEVTESESDSDHIYLGEIWEEERLRSEYELQRSEDELDERFVRSEHDAFELSERELVRIRDERRRHAELERQQEQIEIQDDIIASLYEYHEGEPIDENYYDHGNDQDNGEAPSIEHISEHLVARGVTIDDFVSAMLRTNSAYYISTAEHDRINAVITKHISEIVFEYIMRPQHSATEVISNDWTEPDV